MTTRAEGAAATRERIARAALDLFFERSYEEVTLTAIAAAARVSHQTVLNHFESKEGVVLGVADIVREQTSTARYAATPGDVAGAVHALVGEYERMGDANFRWAGSAERLPNLAQLMEEARQFHQGWLVDMFGERLPPAGAARRRAVNALHAATDTYTWKLLRRDLGLSRSETEKTMVDLVVGILEGGTR